MSDSFIVHRSCGECAKSGTGFCIDADECVKHGYNHFQDPHTLPEKFCPECKQRFKRPRSKKHSDNYRVVYLVCPNCGAKRFLHMEVRGKP